MTAEHRELKNKEKLLENILEICYYITYNKNNIPLLLFMPVILNMEKRLVEIKRIL